MTSHSNGNSIVPDNGHTDKLTSGTQLRAQKRSMYTGEPLCDKDVIKIW